MELLSRLQGGLGAGGGGAAAVAAAAASGGLGAFSGLHPEHLMNLEILQAQHGMYFLSLFIHFLIHIVMVYHNSYSLQASPISDTSL